MRPVRVAFVSPSLRGLGPVMSPAQRREVLRVGLAGWSGVVVGDDVVEVAVAGTGLAVREHAQRVGEPDLFGHPGGRLVPVDRVVAGRVDDRGDPDPAAGGGVPGQPVLDPGHRDCAEVLDGGDATAPDPATSSAGMWTYSWRSRVRTRGGRRASATSSGTATSSGSGRRGRRRRARRSRCRSPWPAAAPTCPGHRPRRGGVRCRRPGRRTWSGPRCHRWRPARRCRPTHRPRGG